MNCGHASDVNSAGTRCSAFSKMGLAAILTGISNSERGSSGSVCCSSFDVAVFFVLLQDSNNISTKKRGRYFSGYPIIDITNENNIPRGKMEVFHCLFCALDSIRKHKAGKNSATVEPATINVEFRLYTPVLKW